jgi:hypothetical protein
LRKEIEKGWLNNNLRMLVCKENLPEEIEGRREWVHQLLCRDAILRGADFMYLPNMGKVSQSIINCEK